MIASYGKTAYTNDETENDMEFNKKLQELRKSKNLTQEELAKSLFVSRTAISKWESGRGYPGIDSLREIAKFFSVSLDELLSADEVLTIAKENERENNSHFHDLVCGLVDVLISLLFFLPFFSSKAEEYIKPVSLIALNISPFVKVISIFFSSLLIVVGILTLALQNCDAALWIKAKRKISLALSAVLSVLFILSLQPYAAVYTLALLAVKGSLLIKRK